MNLNENASRYDHVHGDEDEGPEIAPEELIAARDELADDMLRSEAWFVSMAIQHMDPDILACRISEMFSSNDKADSSHNLLDEAHRLVCEYLEAEHPDKIAAKALRIRKEECE